MATGSLASPKPGDTKMEILRLGVCWVGDREAAAERAEEALAARSAGLGLHKDHAALLAYDVLALVEQVARAEERLRWIADPSYVGNYDVYEVVEIYRKWAGGVVVGRDRAPE